MATTSGTQDIDVRRSALGVAIRDTPGLFDFFQMVRLLERLRKNCVPVGEDAVTRFSLGDPQCDGI